MVKIKCDINQQDLTTVDLHFVKCSLSRLLNHNLGFRQWRNGLENPLLSFSPIQSVAKARVIAHADSLRHGRVFFP